MQRPTSILLASGAALAAGVPRARILVVDDDEILCGLHAGVLTLANFSVETATNGFDALEHLQNSHFDLVVTDWNMPKMDGVSLVRAMRKDGNNVPVVMISGAYRDLESRLPEDVEQQLSVALPKPVRPQEILAAVEFALRRPPARQAETRQLFSQS